MRQTSALREEYFPIGNLVEECDARGQEFPDRESTRARIIRSGD
jgi:hypothetical protein